MILPRFFTVAGTLVAFFGGTGAVAFRGLALGINLTLLYIGVGLLIAHFLHLDEEENIVVAKISSMLFLATAVSWLVVRPDFSLVAPALAAAIAGIVGIGLFAAEEHLLKRDLVSDN